MSLPDDIRKIRIPHSFGFNWYPLNPVLTLDMDGWPKGDDLAILVIEDDAFTRTSVSGALTNAGLKVVASAGDAKSAVYAFTMHDPNVIVVDLDLGIGPTGLDLARSFRLRNPKLGIVMLTSYSDPRLFRNYVSETPAGCEYLVKNQISSIETVKTAVHNAFNNAQSTALVTSGIEHPEWINNLTQVQIETLRMVAQGLSNAEIKNLTDNWGALLLTSLVFSSSDDQFSENESRAALLCIEEGLANALHHGHASEVAITVTTTKTMHVLSLIDNGIGPISGLPGLGSSLFNSCAGSCWSLSRGPEGIGSKLTLQITRQ